MTKNDFVQKVAAKAGLTNRDAAKAVEMLTMMSPVERTRTPEDVAKYCGEPYAVAADVSSAPGRVSSVDWLSS